MKRVIPILVLVIYVVFSSGCVDETSTENPELIAEKISLKVQEKENSIEDSSYTICIKTYFDGEIAQESEFDIVYKKPNMKKTITKGTENETLMIYDGKTEWIYDPGKNIVQEIIVPEEYQESNLDYFKVFNDTLNEYDVSVSGSDAVDGRTAYLLEAKPKEGMDEDDLLDEIRIWVDEETWVPLKYEIYLGTQLVEIEIKNLQINTGIPDSEFSFDTPEGAEVVAMNFEDMFNKNMSGEITGVPAEGGKEKAMIVVV